MPIFGLWNSLAETNLAVHRHIPIIAGLTNLVKPCPNKFTEKPAQIDKRQLFQVLRRAFGKDKKESSQKQKQKRNESYSGKPRLTISLGGEPDLFSNKKTGGCPLEVLK